MQSFLTVEFIQLEMRATLVLTLIALGLAAKAVNGAPIEAAPEQERLLGLIKNVYEMIKVFKQTDANGDGKLSVEEMKTALSGMLPTENLPEPVVEYFDKQLEEFDTNGDGNISLFGKDI